MAKALQTSDGGYILAGYSTSAVNGDKTELLRGGSDYWIVKLSADGSMQWDKAFGGALNDVLTDIQQTSDGGYILGGYSNSGIGGDKSEVSRGSNDYWVVKIDVNGTKQWDKTFGGNNSESLLSVRQTPDGGFILAGSSRSDASGDKTQNRLLPGDENATDFWLVKVSALGTVEWDKAAGTTGYGRLTCFELTADGGYILGANEGAFENVFGQFYIMKLTATGEKQWAKGIGDDQSFSLVTAIHQTSDGGYVLAGYSNSLDGGKPVENNASDDAYIIKIDQGGVKQWERTYGSVDTESIRFTETVTSILQTPDGGYIVGGYSSGDGGGPKTEGSRGGQDFWILKLQSDGALIWDKTIGGNEDDFLSSIVPTTDGGYLLGGYSKSPISREKSTKSQGGQDYWIVELAPEYPPASGLITSFTLQKESGNVKLDWSLLVDPTLDKFEIEYSMDRLEWNLIGNIDIDQTIVNYSYVHTAPVVGVQLHYRLKIIKLDSQITYSKTRSISIIADAPKIQWDKIIGSNYSDYLSAMVPVSDGGYILGGWSGSGIGGDKTEDGRGGGDYWIVKISVDGTKQWDKRFGGPGDDELNSILPTADGGFLLGGGSRSQAGGDKSENSESVERHGYLEEDFWVVKISAEGIKQWDSTIGGNKSDWFSSVRLASDGGYILAGVSNSDSGGDKSDNPAFGANTFDFWIVKIDVNGHKIWDKTITTNGGSSKPIFESTADGGYILGGRSNLNQASGYSLFKLSGNGNLEWSRTVTNVQSDISTLQQTSDNGYIIGGSSYSNAIGEKTENSRGANDYWILKLHEDGSVAWDKTIGSNRNDVLKSVRETSDGGYILAGESNSLAEWEKTDNGRGYPDYWIVKLTENGSKTWDKTIGGSIVDELWFIYETPKGGYILGGNTQSPIGYERTGALISAADFWIVKLGWEEPSLPVELVNFTVKKENTVAVLNWNTTSETASDYFEVQHSLNGKSWYPLDRINAKGESSGYVNYQYIHLNPELAGLNFYRLKMIDKDDSYTFSTILKVNFEFELTIYPNPVSETLKIYAKNWQSVASVALLSKSLSTVYHSSPVPSDTLDVREFQSGLYFLKITKTDGTFSLHRLIISR